MGIKVTVKKGKKSPSPVVEVYLSQDGETSAEWYKRIAEAVTKMEKEEKDGEKV